MDLCFSDCWITVLRFILMSCVANCVHSLSRNQNPLWRGHRRINSVIKLAPKNCSLNLSFYVYLSKDGMMMRTYLYIIYAYFIPSAKWTFAIFQLNLETCSNDTFGSHKFGGQITWRVVCWLRPIKHHSLVLVKRHPLPSDVRRRLRSCCGGEIKYFRVNVRSS